MCVVCPAAGAATEDTPALTDEAVEQAIRRSVAWIQSLRNAASNWEPEGNQSDRFYTGDSALALMALLYAGENPRQEDMNRSLEWLAQQTINATYTRSTRIHALSLVPGKQFRAALQGDLDWLLQAVHPRDHRFVGGYDYVFSPGASRGTSFDNSNSQYGVLGVWMAAEAGLTVPDDYWALVQDHWMQTQQPDGGWSYKERGQSTGSMTAAGLTSLFVVVDQRYANQPTEMGRLLSCIDRGLEWLGREYTPDNPHGEAKWKFYYLYGIERTGRASGRKYFRNKDWFREGASDLLATQDASGGWKPSSDMDGLRNTAFATMFLCHGRAPLLVNKLEHGGDWNNCMRDAAGLTRFAQHTFERLLNWQIVRLDGSLDDLTEAPLLYMTGKDARSFDEVETQVLREYCQRGGMILAVANRGGEPFAASMRALGQRMFPDHPMRPLTAEHPLFDGSVQFPISKPPPLFEINNGVRTLLLLSPADLADRWSRYDVRGSLEEFQLGCNIYLYATDKTTIRSRLETAHIPVRDVPLRRTIRVARISHQGHWDVEPFGWTRLKADLNNTTGSRLLVTSGVTFDSPDLDNFKIAYITGTGAFELTEAELNGLRRFLTGGGTLLSDAAGGAPEFLQSLEACIGEALRSTPRYLPADSVVISGEGIDDARALTEVVYRRAARRDSGGQAYPRLKAFELRRRIAVIYSPLDLSTGLLGTHVYSCRGYDGESCLRILRNMLLYADLSTAQKARLARETEGR